MDPAISTRRICLSSRKVVLIERANHIRDCLIISDRNIADNSSRTKGISVILKDNALRTFLNANNANMCPMVISDSPGLQAISGTTRTSFHVSRIAASPQNPGCDRTASPQANASV